MAKIIQGETKNETKEKFTLASKGLTKKYLKTKYLYLGGMINAGDKTYGHSKNEFSCYVWAEILTRDIFTKTKVKVNVEELAYVLFLCWKRSPLIFADTNKVEARKRLIKQYGEELSWRMLTSKAKN